MNHTVNRERSKIVAELADRYKDLSHEEALSFIYCNEYTRLEGLTLRQLLDEYLEWKGYDDE